MLLRKFAGLWSRLVARKVVAARAACVFADVAAAAALVASGLRAD